jgi:hypothetical protein
MKSKFLCTIAFGLLAMLVGCRRPNADPAEDATRLPSAAPAAPAEEWVAQPPHEWPQLVLTNDAQSQGHTSLRGASAFLIRTRDGRTLAATAKHLIGANGGVQPEIPIAGLDAAIRSWRLHPRTLPSKFIEADKVAAKGLDDGGRDWLILTLKPASRPLPALPLRLRPRRVQVGEEVYLVGCPYAEEQCQQNVYKGRVTERLRDRFRYDIAPPVDIRGFSGAPILDRDGHVVGIMTVWFEPITHGDQFLEAGGEDAGSIYDLVQTPR